MKSIAIFLFAVAFSIPAYAQDAPKKIAGIDQILKSPNLQKSKVGIQVIDVATGKSLYAKKATTGFNPASNAKIVTAAVAFDELGPTFTYATRLSAGRLVDGVVKTLYIKGEGDPLIFYDDMVTWAVRLKAKGITAVEGIVIDESAWESGYTAPGFDQQKEDASYRAPIGPVSTNFNMTSVIVTPAQKGKPATVTVFPPNDYVKLKSTVKTGSGRQVKVNASASVDGTRTTVTLSGTIGESAAPASYRKRIDHPALYFGSVLTHAFNTVGLKVSGDVRTGKRPEKTTTLHFHGSEPLWHIAALMNKWSNNFIAEQLYKTIGSEKKKSATTDLARARIKSFMQRAGVAPDAIKTMNGSGLYVGNEYSPDQIAKVLTFMTTHDAYPEFAMSLAIAGSDGTLSSRLKGSRMKLRAKTGTLSIVSALSGYAKTKSGRLVAFSIIFNNTPIKAWRLRALQDAIAKKIVQSN